MFLSSFRDAPEATGDEPEDADFETPKIYEAVSLDQISLNYCCFQIFNYFLLPRFLRLSFWNNDC